MNDQMLQAFILHTRPFRETSLILDLLTPEGRVSAVQKGVRKKTSSKQSKTSRTPQPFETISVSLYGRGELKNIKRVEEEGKVYRLQGNALVSGLYLNELLVRLLHTEEPHPQLFIDYETALLQLEQQPEAVEPALRKFEYQLLCELGYGFEFPNDRQTGDLLFTHESEFISIDASQPANLLAGFGAQEEFQSRCFRAADLCAFAAHDFTELDTRRAAKRLMRIALRPLLGSKPLKSRALFIS